MAIKAHEQITRENSPIENVVIDLSNNTGGNLVPNVFKQSGKATLMGRTSGGGSCVVQPISSAWGTSFTISASRRMSFLKNGSLYDIDRGADPDYVISRPEKYYDRKALTDYINGIY